RGSASEISARIANWNGARGCRSILFSEKRRNQNRLGAQSAPARAASIPVEWKSIGRSGKYSCGIAIVFDWAPARQWTGRGFTDASSEGNARDLSPASQCRSRGNADLIAVAGNSQEFARDGLAVTRRPGRNRNRRNV